MVAENEWTSKRVASYAAENRTFRYFYYFVFEVLI